MYRIVPPSCGVCGSNAAYQMESFDVTLCYQCARAAVEWLYRNQCWDNPIGVDLIRGMFDYAEGRGYRIWIRSDSGGNAMTDQWLTPNPKFVLDSQEEM